MPQSDRQPVKGTPLPPRDAGGGQVWAALDGQTAKLDQSNERNWRVIEIFAACRVQQDKLRALLEPKRPWWRFF